VIGVEVGRPQEDAGCHVGVVTGLVGFAGVRAFEARNSVCVKT
jgi:hypothetical protein